MLIIASVGMHDIETKTRKVILTGADIIRFNFSRRSPEDNVNFVQTAKGIINNLNSNAKVLIDMPISKIRLGDFDVKTFAVRENEEFICKSASYSPDCNEFIPIDAYKIGEKVRPNQTITIGDGEIAVQVVEILNNETFRIKILNNGIIPYMKAFNIEPDSNEKMIDTYKILFEKIKIIEPNYLAFSYLGVEKNNAIKNILKKEIKFADTKFIIKIDDKTGVENAKKIMEDRFYDMVLLDRGELGVNLPFEKLGIIQKQIIQLSKEYNKPLLISTQILESTINNFIPSRSEIQALTDIILEDVKGIVLCRETGYNTRPAYTISIAKKIISAAEEYKKNIK